MLQGLMRSRAVMTTKTLVTCSRRRLDRAMACCILSLSNSLARSSFKALALFCTLNTVPRFKTLLTL